MEKTIYNLVRNSIDYDIGEYFVNEIIKQMSNDEIVKLARAELKIIKYLVFIELDNWHYWKDKEQRLVELIHKLNFLIQNDYKLASQFGKYKKGLYYCNVIKTKQHIMTTCIKNIKTKKGLEFIKGNEYDFTIHSESIRVYLDKVNSVVIK